MISPKILQKDDIDASKVILCRGVFKEAYEGGGDWYMEQKDSFKDDIVLDYLKKQEDLEESNGIYLVNPNGAN